MYKWPPWSHFFKIIAYASYHENNIFLKILTASEVEENNEFKK